MADIPGLIAGASQGAGLGHRFLGHVERCTLLLHLIDATQDNVTDAYQTIRTELAAYDQALAGRDEMIALNKCDLLDEQTLAEKAETLRQASGRDIMIISGAAHMGVDALCARLLTEIDQKRAHVQTAPRHATHWRP